jgi:hypothetical protein
MNVDGFIIHPNICTWEISRILLEKRRWFLFRKSKVNSPEWPSQSMRNRRVHHP